MKTSAVILALAATTTVAVSADVAECDQKAIRGFLLDKTCVKAAPVFKPFKEYSSEGIAQLYAASKDCNPLFNSLASLNPTECVVPGGKGFLLYKNLLTPFFACSPNVPLATPALVTPAPSPVTPAPVPVTSAPTPTTATPTLTPEPTLPKPAC